MSELFNLKSSVLVRFHRVILIRCSGSRAGRGGPTRGTPSVWCWTGTILGCSVFMLIGTRFCSRMRSETTCRLAGILLLLPGSYCRQVRRYPWRSR
ncbi:hypothetical protein LINPERPRIM_LOCUS539 [Linum perenne]